MPNIPLFLFCMMFVRLAQKPRVRFILCRVMKGRGGSVLCVSCGANTLFPKKLKILISEKKKISKTKKRKICVCFQMCDAIKHQTMPFEPIFSPVERMKPQNGVVISLCLRKCLRMA